MMRIWTFSTSYTSCARFPPEPRKADQTKNKPMRIWSFITSYTSCASFPPEPRKAGQGINKPKTEDNKDLHIDVDGVREHFYALGRTSIARVTTCRVPPALPNSRHAVAKAG